MSTTRTRLSGFVAEMWVIINVVGRLRRNCIAICELCAGNLAEPDIDSIKPTAIYDERTFILQEATYSLALAGTFRVAGIEDPLSM